MRRWVFTWLVGGVAALWSEPAACALLDITVTGDAVHAPPGSVVTVSVTIANLGAETVFLNGISSDVTADFAKDDIFDPFDTFAPDSLGPGEAWEGPILQLTVSSEAPESLQVFDIRLSGGGHSYVDQEIGLTYFTVDGSAAVTAVSIGMITDSKLRIDPNPFRGQLGIDLTSRVDGRWDVAVFDVSGRLIAPLFSGDLRAGPHHFSWDGRQGAGAPTNGGVYFIRASQGGRILKTKVLKLE